MSSCYVLSRDSRCYAVLEPAYGVAGDIGSGVRIPLIGLRARQEFERVRRRDKRGTRTFGGYPKGVRRLTSFELEAYLTSWAPGAVEPAYGSLFRSALGNAWVFEGGVVESVNGRTVRLVENHGLRVGQGISIGGEVRFVVAVVDSRTVILNAPWTREVVPGVPVDRTVTYAPGKSLPSVSIAEYWGEAGVDRLLIGAVVDELTIRVNGDYHGFRVRGFAQDLLDRHTFEAGSGGLVEFPPEPGGDSESYAPVAGTLGQAWLGSGPDQFYTLTEAELTVRNHVRARAMEFGWQVPRCAIAGDREVTVDFSLFVMPDQPTVGLYVAAKRREPVEVFFQLGDQAGQVCGLYMPAVVPEVPEYEDKEMELEWRFTGCIAQGTAEDEIFVAFA